MYYALATAYGAPLWTKRRLLGLVPLVVRYGVRRRRGPYGVDAVVTIGAATEMRDIPQPRKKAISCTSPGTPSIGQSIDQGFTGEPMADPDRAPRPAKVGTRRIAKSGFFLVLPSKLHAHRTHPLLADCGT
jgi:hypothetical protein